jgi:hypothetical protein
MEKLQTLYNLLQVNLKIENTHVRLLYLKDVWGMEQSLIGECEGYSQSYVSKEIIKARKNVTRETMIQETEQLWSAEEIQYLQFLPREVIEDIPVLAFIENILGVVPLHPFFQYIDTSEQVRIAALSSLGIQHKRLQTLFHKNQSTISMVVKRSQERALAIERPHRYEKTATYVFAMQESPFTFKKAGGIDYDSYTV